MNDLVYGKFKWMLVVREQISGNKFLCCIVKRGSFSVIVRPRSRGEPSFFHRTTGAGLPLGGVQGSSRLEPRTPEKSPASM